jgi:predicted acylesterase/phospholipase RssA
MEYSEEALDIIKNKTGLMISGGGSLGIAMVGCLERLVELGFSLAEIKVIKGSSIGSIIATAIACGADIHYMKQKIGDIDLNIFRDRDLFCCSLWQLITKYGLNKTRPIKIFASSILEELTGNKDITFLELYQRTGVHLIITYLSVNIERTIYADWITEPNSSIRETIVKSSAIPVFYEAYYNKKNKQIAVDGGTLDNYSFNYLRDFSSKILGLKLVSDGYENDITNVGAENALTPDRGYPKTVSKYLERLIYLMRDQAMRLHVKEKDWMSSIKIHIGHYNSTDFDLTREEKDWLFNQGRIGADSYIKELTSLIQNGKYSQD